MNKEICLKCWEKKYDECIVTIIDPKLNKKEFLREVSSKMTNQKIVCFFGDNPDLHRKNYRPFPFAGFIEYYKPPENCYYFLEQTVLGQEKDKTI